MELNRNIKLLNQASARCVSWGRGRCPSGGWGRKLVTVTVRVHRPAWATRPAHLLPEDPESSSCRSVKTLRLVYSVVVVNTCSRRIPLSRVNVIHRRSFNGRFHTYLQYQEQSLEISNNTHLWTHLQHRWVLSNVTFPFCWCTRLTTHHGLLTLPRTSPSLCCHTSHPSPPRSPPICDS